MRRGAVMRFRWHIMAVGVGMALIGAAPAEAAISCTVSSAGLAFGVYNVLASTAKIATGTVTVNCTGDTESANNRILFLSGGGSGNYNARRMLSGASQLTYQIYSNSIRTTIWGDGFNGTASVNLAVQVPGSASATLYGRIPALQSVPSGSYLDTILVTVNF